MQGLERMLERQLFRFTLLVAALVVLLIGGASAYRYIEAKKLQSRIEDIVEYQKRMEEPCRARPTFPACLSNEEYLVKYLTAVKDELEADMRVKELLPWAIWPPFVLLIAFYAIRWGVTGRIRPLWLLGSIPRKT